MNHNNYDMKKEKKWLILIWRALRKEHFVLGKLLSNPKET